MSAVEETLEEHYRFVALSLKRGKVVPLLGAGVNLCEPGRSGWVPDKNLPDGSELSRFIAKECSYPGEDEADLLRVSQYAQVKLQEGLLYDALHEVFDAKYGFTVVHEFLARLPATLEAAGGRRRYQLIVTTNYDDALEQALSDAGEPFDLVWYKAHPSGAGEAEQRGIFMHTPHGETARPIERPNEYHLPVDRRTVILKIHGAVSRADGDEDSYVISEDDYIKFLTHSSLQQLIPSTLLAKLFTSQILFLGYSLQDWNLRVILHQIATQRDLRRLSWAIQKQVKEVDRMLWDHRNVRLHEVALEEYVDELRKRMSDK